MTEACNGTKVDVAVACEPNSMRNVSAEMNMLQTDLAAAIAAHRAADQRVATEVAAHNATKAHFGNISAEAAAKQLAAQKSEIEFSRQSLFLTSERLAGVVSELEETRKQLQENRTLHQAASKSGAAEQKQLQGMLSEASTELRKTHVELKTFRAENNALHVSHVHSTRSLLGEVAFYEAKWRDEQTAHNKTKGQLKSESEAHDEARSWLVLSLVALGFVMVACMGCIIFMVARARKWRSLALSRAANMGAQVVLGRPVGVNEGVGDTFPNKPQASDGNPPVGLVSTPKVAWSA